MSKPPHSQSGALHAVSRDEERGRILAYLIAGHHAGLPDWSAAAGSGMPLDILRKKIELLRDALQGAPPQTILNAPLPMTMPRFQTPEAAHVWIRMLFSCLVDADFLDTEQFMDADKAKLRPSYPDLPELKHRLDVWLERKTAEAPRTPLNNRRQKILEACREGARQTRGVFTLTVPTGGGKTLSSMAFALEHALAHGQRRVIVVIPFTSIIEQTAAEYRKIFGDDAVLEHHSNLDPHKETPRSRLAAENWDAPVIVTTTVQFFESLLAAKTSRCRKLHNIAASVVILDEVQALPPEHLTPLRSLMQSLTDWFNVTLVLCTATQPAPDRAIHSGQARLKAFRAETVRDLLPPAARRELAGAFARVRVELLDQLAPRTWKEIAGQLIRRPHVLAVVNTRKDCRELHSLMPKGTYHLSALMCPAHRSEVIGKISAGLENFWKEVQHDNGPRRLEDIAEKHLTAPPLRVISTQVLEAGVDIDFPVVFRALAGWDSIAQAFGRCNREGILEAGHGCVFQPKKLLPSGLLRKAQDAALDMFTRHPERLQNMEPEAFAEYFNLFYSKISTFDKEGIQDMLAGPDAYKLKFQFRSAAERFRMIDNTGRQAVLVLWRGAAENSEKALDELRRIGPKRSIMRRLQRFSVNVFDQELERMRQNGTVEDMHGIWVQCSPRLYTQEYGLNIDAELDFFM